MHACAKAVVSDFFLCLSSLATHVPPAFVSFARICLCGLILICDARLRSELGVVRWFFTLCRLYFERVLDPILAEARVKCLSVRVAAALRELGAPPVHRIFEKKHGSITGAQYRCVFHPLFLYG